MCVVHNCAATGIFFVFAAYEWRITAQWKTSYFNTLHGHSHVIFALFYPVPVGQPQSRSTPLQRSLTSPSESATLLKNGKSLKHQVNSNGAKNGAALLRAVSSTSSSSSSHHKSPKKLHSNPSINSHSSKRSKGSSKSNSSQIPTENQDGG